MTSSVSTIRTLPIISIAPYLQPGDTEGRASTSAALHAACLEFGFFYLDLTAYVDQAQPEELTSLAREFFSLPQEEKNKIALKNEDYARGMISIPTILSDQFWHVY
jgi:isopenicillin N synthase-like dioxygenase